MEISNNVNAIQNQLTQLNDNASSISNAGLNTNASEDITRALTDNISLENGIDAQIASISTQDDVLGMLLDVLG